jgi:hypothetical protein
VSGKYVAEPKEADEVDHSGNDAEQRRKPKRDSPTTPSVRSLTASIAPEFFADRGWYLA